MTQLNEKAFKDAVIQLSHILISIFNVEVDDECQQDILQQFTSQQSAISCLVFSSAFGMG